MSERTGPYDAPRRAVEQATEVIGRLLRAFDVPPAVDPLAVDEPAPDGETATFAQLRSSVSRAVDLYLDLFQRTFDAYVDTTERALRRRGLTASGDQGGDSLILVPDRVSGVAAGALYLHNFSGHPVGGVGVRVTDLTAHDGSVVPASAIDVAPHPTGSLDDGATFALQVRADIASTPPGTYHGHALLEGGALAVRLEVPAP